MNIKLLFFATLRDAAGGREMDFELESGSTVADLLEKLGRAHPKLAPYLETSLVSVNKEYSPAETALSDEDEVALFPPVSGG
jgi:molybdopterin converting factor subunit 1